MLPVFQFVLFLVQHVSAFLLSVFNKMKLMKINCFAVPAVGDRNAGSVIFQNCAFETSGDGFLYACNCNHLHKIPPRKSKQLSIWILGARCTAVSRFCWAQWEKELSRRILGLILCQVWVCHMGYLAKSVSSMRGRMNYIANTRRRGSVS